MEILGFEFSRFPGKLCRDPGKFFLYFKGVNGTDIYHSDVKICSCNVSIFLLVIMKVIFQNLQNFLLPNAWEIKKFFLN